MKHIHHVTLFIVSFGIAALSLVVSFFVAERFFFDRLFYQKSPTHGYGPYFYELSLHQNNNPLLEKRIKDIRALLSLTSLKKINVLGEADSQPYHIVVVGDSMAYGLGVREHEVFARVLERKLNTIRPTQVSLLAQPGDSIVENYAKYLLAKEYIMPNLYVISLTSNDFIYDRRNKYPNENHVYSRLKSLCVGDEFRYTWVNEGWIDMFWNAILPAFQSDVNRCFFIQAVQDITQTKDNVIFLSLDFAGTGGAPGTYEEKFYELMEGYRLLITQGGGNTLTAEHISGATHSSVSNKEGHPSKETHRFYAQALFQEIVGNPRWGFVKKP